MANIYQELPKVLERFPNLQHLRVDRVPSLEGNGRPLVWKAISKFLHLNSPDNLESMIMHSFFVKRQWHINYPKLSSLIQKLRYFSYNSYNGRDTHNDVLQLLQCGENLRRVKLFGIRFDSDGCSDLVHPKAPLQRLLVAKGTLPASYLESLANFRRTLKEVDLCSVELTVGTWRTVLGQFVSGFDSLINLELRYSALNSDASDLYEQCSAQVKQRRKRLGLEEKVLVDLSCLGCPGCPGCPDRLTGAAMYQISINVLDNS
ncbi:hypothetical protein BDW59DRAFT_165353 [Aspergillus cavernicola]|uniref:F-box domain-containing protein n=1 Tax=Aspergillus cavernicola TaxID=176166 RepID=A0ABR4HVQ2_9EURO